MTRQSFDRQGWIRLAIELAVLFGGGVLAYGDLKAEIRVLAAQVNANFADQQKYEDHHRQMHDQREREVDRRLDRIEGRNGEEVEVDPLLG
jgi:hypothetical protein